MDLKGVIADHMGHFSVYDIPNLVFVLVAATFMGYVLAYWGAGQKGSDARGLALWAAAAALATAFVRAQLPLAALVLAAAVLVGRAENGPRPAAVFFSALLFGIGCGSGAAVIVGIALVPYLLIMRWSGRRPIDK